MKKHFQYFVEKSKFFFRYKYHSKVFYLHKVICVFVTFVVDIKFNTCFVNVKLSEDCMSLLSITFFFSFFPLVDATPENPQEMQVA